ncbi:MAG TPA: DUF4390 domain-containing protein [Gemmatimonadales bacterium]
MQRLLLVATLALAAAPMATAQQRVRLEVTTSEPVPETGLRRPVVRTPDILRDPRWVESLQNSFPLRLQFRVEIWRVRTDWFDALEQAFEWETVVQYEPLVDQYAKTVLFGGSPRSVQRFASLQELERDLERANVVSISAAGRGEYYFTASLQIRTLTDEEVEEMERFLAGDPATDAAQQPGAVKRAARRLLLRFGGLPTESLEARSARFPVTR